MPRLNYTFSNNVVNNAEHAEHAPSISLLPASYDPQDPHSKSLRISRLTQTFHHVGEGICGKFPLTYQWTSCPRMCMKYHMPCSRHPQLPCVFVEPRQPSRCLPQGDCSPLIQHGKARQSASQKVQLTQKGTTVPVLLKKRAWGFIYHSTFGNRSQCLNHVSVNVRLPITIGANQNHDDAM